MCSVRFVFQKSSGFESKVVLEGETLQRYLVTSATVVQYNSQGT